MHYPRMSEETNAFSADLYIQGQKAGFAENRGTGGPNNYRATSQKGQELIRRAEDYCKGLEPLQSSAGDESFTIEMNLDLFIDDLLTAHFQQKQLERFRKKMSKEMQQGVIFGVPDQSYRCLKLPVPVSVYLTSPSCQDILANLLRDRVLPQMRKEDTILNTNIPSQIYSKAGLDKSRFPDVIPTESHPEEDHAPRRKR